MVSPAVCLSIYIYKLSFFLKSYFDSCVESSFNSIWDMNGHWCVVIVLRATLSLKFLFLQRWCKLLPTHSGVSHY